MPDKKAKKTKYQKLEEKLFIRKKSVWEVWSESTKKKAFGFAEDYKNFSNNSKTEREAVKTGIQMAEAQGFKKLSQVKKLKAGDQVYFSQHGKSLILARIGKKKISETGLKMLMAHVDSPHLDLKVNPLYEDENLAFFKTHYYGAIKKYQWPTITLALHGVVFLKNGKNQEIKIGEKDSEPIFMITDLLPHLDRPDGPGSKIETRGIKGEDLNLLIGSIPVKDEKIKEKVKLAILAHLNREYGICEVDFNSAELQAVPANKARDLGFDRSLIAAYGHDDRVCSFACLSAFLDAKNISETQICMLVDREEIGSDGNTGAQSLFLESFISSLLALNGEAGNMNLVYKSFYQSKAISADVTPALDPDYKDVHDLRGAHHLGFGLAMEKYVGGRGKSFTSEATGEFIRELKNIFDRDKNLVYQISGGLGKVDQGGAGTIAMYIANRNIDIIDAGVPVLNMHAPLEIVSKADLYCAYLGYKAFLNS